MQEEKHQSQIIKGAELGKSIANKNHYKRYQYKTFIWRGHKGNKAKQVM